MCDVWCSCCQYLKCGVSSSCKQLMHCMWQRSLGATPFIRVINWWRHSQKVALYDEGQGLSRPSPLRAQFDVCGWKAYPYVISRNWVIMSVLRFDNHASTILTSRPSAMPWRVLLVHEDRQLPVWSCWLPEREEALDRNQFNFVG